MKYLGHWLSKGKRKLDPERISGILSLSPPKTKREIRQVLGLLGYYRQWIEGYSEKVKFLYEKLVSDRLKWTEEDENRFQKLKETLAEPPVLSLPDVKRPFQLFITTSNQTAYGVLTQDWAGSKRPIAYFFKIVRSCKQGLANMLTIFSGSSLTD